MFTLANKTNVRVRVRAYACVGAGEPEEDEEYESGVLDANGVYRLHGDKLVPDQDAWASIPSVSLLDSKEVLLILYYIQHIVLLHNGGYYYIQHIVLLRNAGYYTKYCYLMLDTTTYYTNYYYIMHTMIL